MEASLMKGEPSVEGVEASIKASVKQWKLPQRKAIGGYHGSFLGLEVMELKGASMNVHALFDWVSLFNPP